MMFQPTIVKTTKDYILVRIPLPKGGQFERIDTGPPRSKTGKTTPAERRLWKIIQEGERDFREGRIISAPSIREAMRRYEKRQWDT